MPLPANNTTNTATGIAQRVVARASSAVGKLRRAALDLAFPSACVSCGREMLDHSDNNELDAPFCRSCIKEMHLFSGRACARCAMPLTAAQDSLAADETQLVLPLDPPVAWVRTRPRDCQHCRGRRYWFHSAVAAGRYSDRLRELILKMKRAEQNWMSLSVGQLLWASCQAQLEETAADVVAPVPLHWRRRFTHGTNSAALVAETVAARLHLPLAPRLLKRRRNTQPQFSLSPAQRRSNVRGAFTPGTGYPIEKAHVLLVDDIMTSGATANEAARILRQAGAGRVTVAVVARALPIL